MVLEEDFLENDQAIPGQNFVCLSFVSPADNIAKKEELYMKEFLKKYCEELGVELDKAMDFVKKYEDFKFSNIDGLNKMYNEQNEGVCSIRGLKVRGVFDSIKEAQMRAKKLQKMDNTFHVFVGQVGFWLPWDPEPSNIDNEEYTESQLNDLVKNYKENSRNKEELFLMESRERFKEQNKTTELNTNDQNTDGQTLSETKELVFDSRTSAKSDPLNTTDNVEDLNAKSEENLTQIKDELFEQENLR